MCGSFAGRREGLPLIVLDIGDTHAPFAHRNTLDFLADLNHEWKPDVVVHIGDLGDQYGWSRHGRQEPDAPGQGEEWDKVLAWNRQLYKIFPDVKACIGNHDKRLAKAAARAGIPARFVKSIPDMYECPRGWKWRDYWIIDGVVHAHGVGFNGENCAVTAARWFGRSCVIGHTHSVGGVRWLQSEVSRVFGCSTGCLVDQRSIGMAYAKESKSKPVLGSSIIVDGIPQFIPMGEK